MQQRVKRVTVKEVARDAGVSTASVSRVLNGSAEVSESLAERVRLSASRLGYSPNALTRSIFQGHSNMIGVVIGDLKSPFYLDLARGLEGTATPQGCSVIFTNTQRDEVRERTQILGLEELRVRGLVVTTQLANSALTRSVAERGTNVVLVTQRMTRAPANVFSIRLDNAAGGRLAWRHLHDHGRSRVAVVAGGKGLATQNSRLRGIRAAAKKAGLDVPDEVVRRLPVSDPATAYEAVVDLLGPGSRGGQGIDGLICCSGAFLVGVTAALRDLHVRVPDDVGLIGFDHFDWASQLQPALTLVTQPAHDMGQLAAEILTQDHGGRFGGERVFPPGLEVGESAGESLVARKAKHRNV